MSSNKYLRCTLLLHACKVDLQCKEKFQFAREININKISFKDEFKNKKYVSKLILLKYCVLKIIFANNANNKGIFIVCAQKYAKGNDLVH